MNSSETFRGGQLRPANKGKIDADSGRKHIVTIGINSYQYLNPLRNAYNDAQSVQTFFVDRLGYNAPLEPLLDDRATQQAINSMVQDQLRQLLLPEDKLILFFAGHGLVREDERGGAVGFLGPVEAEANVWGSCVRIDTLLDEIGRLPALHILVIIDTCFSGHALGGTFARHVQAGDSGRPASRRVITSARANQLALDSDHHQNNSPFTSILLEAFSLPDNQQTARSDFDQNGEIIGVELGLYMQLEFGKGSQYDQMPDFGTFHHDERGEFVIATLGTAQQRDNPDLLAILQDAQSWLRNKGHRDYLYRDERLAAALDWRVQQDNTAVRDEVDTFLNASKQWRQFRRLAISGAALIVIMLLYLAGLGIYRSGLKYQARAETAEYPTATIHLGGAETAVTINTFILDIHEVSAQQYNLCYKASGCSKPAGQPDYDNLVLSEELKLLPVVNVDVFNARDYCSWQGGRLPTAAEWEYAVRGTAYRTWPWGIQDPTRSHININLFNTPDLDPYSHGLVAVQSPEYTNGTTDKGVWHLLGNAREWTSTFVANCPSDENGKFMEVYQCEVWDGSDSVPGLFAAGLSFRDDLIPEETMRVSEYLNVNAIEARDDLGFRCAYDQ